MQNLGGQIRCIMGNKWCMDGKRLDKNRVRIRKRAACFLKMSELLELFKILQTAGNYGFKTLGDIFEKVDRLLPTLKSHPNAIHSPLKIFLFLLLQTEYESEFVYYRL